MRSPEPVGSFCDCDEGKGCTVLGRQKLLAEDFSGNLPGTHPSAAAVETSMKVLPITEAERK